MSVRLDELTSGLRRIAALVTEDRRMPSYESLDLSDFRAVFDDSAELVVRCLREEVERLTDGERTVRVLITPVFASLRTPGCLYFVACPGETPDGEVTLYEPGMRPFAVSSGYQAYTLFSF